MSYLIRLLFYARSRWWRLGVGFLGAIIEMVLALRCTYVHKAGS